MTFEDGAEFGLFQEVCVPGLGVAPEVQVGPNLGWGIRGAVWGGGKGVGGNHVG